MNARASGCSGGIDVAFWNGSLNLGWALHPFTDVQGIISGAASHFNRLKHSKFRYGKLFDESTLDVSVSGIGAEPPIITVTPDSLYSALFTGETETQILTITNDGGRDLEWEIDISENRSASNNNRNIGFYADESRTPAGPVALPSNVMSRPGSNNDDGSRDG